MVRKYTAHQVKEICALLREAVILRDGEKCLKCGKRDKLQMSHIYPRRYKRMIYDFDNLKLLCVGCHLYWWHKNPIEAHEWLVKTVDEKRLQRLKFMSEYKGVNRGLDYNESKIYLNNEINKMKYERRSLI